MSSTTQAKRDRDPIPENFNSVEEAVEFWDTHSAADYWDIMEEVDLQFDVKGHIFLMQIQEDIYTQARALARSKRLSLEELVNQLLAREVEKVPA
ncbi:MAG: hypothetical protein DWI57_05270 [Chloroflexi bacterium]|nr:MAG: hypothetical protein DWI57_05270 [Chloroflexota bacterium]